MKKTALLAIVLLAIKTAAHAVPVEINYQGVLTDQAGNPINGVRAIQLKIYDAPTGGNITYTEDLGNVSVQDGICSFSFGANGTSNPLTAPVSGITDAIIGSNQAWVETSINGVSQTPRQKILTVPYALAAKKSEDAQLLNSSVSTLQTQTSGLSSNMTAVQVQVNGVSSNVTALSSNLTALQSQSAGLSESFGTLNATVSGLSSNITALTSESPQTQLKLDQLSNLIQRINLTGVSMPNHFADNTSGGSASGLNSTFLEGSSATWLSASKKYSSTILLSPPTTSFGWVGAWGWAVMARTSINAQVSRITGTMSLSNGNYNSAEIRFVYSDNSTQGFSRGSGSFDITNPSPNKPVKSIDYYGGTPSNQAQGATISNFVSYPVASQRRFVDINLSSKGIVASYVSLVADNMDSQRITFQVKSESWESQEYASSQVIQIPALTSISGLRIFLNYSNSSPSFDGADLQGYSLKYW